MLYGIPMKPHAYERELHRLLRSNDRLMAILMAVREDAPPEAVVGGGVIRGAVWDRLHGYAGATPVPDVDVAFLDPHDLRPERDQSIEARLSDRLPGVPWDVKNQAAVRLWYERKFGVAVTPLELLEDAVGTWPETATCVAVRLLPNDELCVLAPLGLADLFEMILRRNSRRCHPELFRQRLRENRYKGDFCPQLPTPRRLLHPRNDDLTAHLQAGPGGSLTALTETGRFHLGRLHLNRPPLVAPRRRRADVQSRRGRLEAVEAEQLRSRERIAALERNLQRVFDPIEHLKEL